MSEVKLGYGQQSLHFDFDPERFSILGVDSTSETPLTDVEIGQAFDTPIGAPTLDDLIGSSDSVLLVVSDATRATASAQIVNLLVRRLIQTGVSPVNLSIIFATGIHRAVRTRES
jgi:nickel-dependent lactate racemase